MIIKKLVVGVTCILFILGFSISSSADEIDLQAVDLATDVVSILQREVDESNDSWQREINYCINYRENVPNGVLGCYSQAITYMGYHKVTLRTSAQYFLLNSTECYTDIVSGIRMIGDRYCIALGSYYTDRIGTKVDLVFENGVILKCILGDQKADEHTNLTHQFHLSDGSVAEFIVDYAYFSGHPEQWSYLIGGKSRIRKVVIIPSNL